MLLIRFIGVYYYYYYYCMVLTTLFLVIANTRIINTSFSYVLKSNNYILRSNKQRRWISSSTSTTTQIRRSSKSMSPSNNANVKSSDDDEDKIIKKYAIIGSGAAGLASARAIQKKNLDNNNNINITILEKDDTIAGVWNYKSNSNTRPMYKGLRTNLPKEIMAYRELPFSKNVDESFITHNTVKEYLQDYCNYFNLEQYIKYNCTVTQLTCIPDTVSTICSNNSNNNNNEKWNKIRLDWIDGSCNENNDNDDDNNNSNNKYDIFDAVLICNGHYSIPSIPNIPGLDEYYKGDIIHSIEYDIPEKFIGNKTILCIGGRASGSDIAREIASLSSNYNDTKVYLSDTTFPTTTATEPITAYNVTWVSKTIEILSDGRVVFDNDIMEPIHVDIIIFCSGYEYNFPFINEKSNIIEFDTDRRRVKPLYEQLWHAYYPNIAFIGIPHSILPFPFFELQAQAVIQSWDINNNNTILPCLEERINAAYIDAESGGEGKDNGRIPEDTHYLGSAQWDYCRRMAKYANIYNDELENYLATNKTIYEHTGKERKGDFPAGPDSYRSICYDRDDNNRSFILRIRSKTMKEKSLLPV